MAAYPVTYAQYKSFLDADDGYRSERWWKDLEWESSPGLQIRPYGSYPADQVSWHDTTAFCRWLSHRLGGAVEARLPDEWEWQWAARSVRHDFIYPWGTKWLDGVANTEESGIGRTTAVGMYPGGRNLQGIYDLAGNTCAVFGGYPRRWAGVPTLSAPGVVGWARPPSVAALLRAHHAGFAHPTGCGHRGGRQIWRC